MLELVTLPVFRDGMPAAATDLNRIAKMQAFLRARNRRLNMGVLKFDPQGGDPRFIYHLYRYLRFKVNVGYSIHDNAAWLNINGNTAHTIDYVHDTAAYTVTGYVDLNSLTVGDGLPLNYAECYEVKWEMEDPGESPFDCMEIYESPTTSGALAFPTSNPTFAAGSVVTAANLNAISSNLQYLVSGSAYVTDTGCVGYRSYIATPEVWRLITYILPHVHNYLYVRAVWYAGSNANVLHFKISIAGEGTLYENSFSKGATGTGSGWWTNGNTRQYGVFIDLTSVGLTVGDWYTVMIEVKKEEYDDYTDFQPWMVAETPDTGSPAY